MTLSHALHLAVLPLRQTVCRFWQPVFGLLPAGFHVSAALLTPVGGPVVSQAWLAVPAASQYSVGGRDQTSINDGMWMWMGWCCPRILTKQNTKSQTGICSVNREDKKKS